MWQFISLHGPQEEETLLCLLDQVGCVQAPAEVLRNVHSQIFKTFNFFNRHSINVKWAVMGSPASPEIHYDLFGFLCVEDQHVQTKN